MTPVGLADSRVGDLAEHGVNALQGHLEVPRPGGVELLDRVADPELPLRRGLFDRRLPVPPAAQELVGILGATQAHDPGVDPQGRVLLDGAESRLLAGRVSVEGENHFIGETLEEPKLDLR